MIKDCARRCGAAGGGKRENRLLFHWTETNPSEKTGDPIAWAWRQLKPGTDYTAFFKY